MSGKLARWSRVILKMSGEALASASSEETIDHATVDRIAGEIAEAVSTLGVQIGVVIGGGQHLAGGHRRRPGDDGPGHERPHGNARHGHQRPRPAGGSRAARADDPGPVRHRHGRRVRAVHPAAGASGISRRAGS